MRVWLLTGCSSGIGRLLVERALAEGDQVVATARKVETLSDLGADCEDRIQRLSLDVRDSVAVESAVSSALARFGRIDVLVNNAGYGYFSTQEEASLDDVKVMFDTNVFGLIAVTQAVLPTMRDQRSGTIVNLSSMAGHIATPRGGFYQASKWAVEALGEALSLEVGEWGIRVVLVEPGRFETKFGTSAQLGPREEDEESPYRDLRKRWRSGGEKLFPDNQDPREIIERTLRAVNGDELLVRVPVGKDAIHVIERREKMGNAAFAEWMRTQFAGN